MTDDQIRSKRYSLRGIWLARSQASSSAASSTKSGPPAADVEGAPWSVLRGHGDGENAERRLGAAVVESKDWVGTFQIERAGREPAIVNVYSNVIEDDDRTPAF